MSWTHAGLTSALAWTLACATLFFVGLGLRDEQDILLLLGTACVFVADVCFAVHLRSQKLGGSGGLFVDLVDGANATQATFFACSAAAALYAFAHQVALVRARGCGGDEGGDGAGADALLDGASSHNDETQETARLRAALSTTARPQPAAAVRRRE